MTWLDPPEAPTEARRGPPKLPGSANIPPMPVVSTDGPAPPNKTIEVQPHWVELVEERRAKNAQKAKAEAERARPIIPREEE